jgi:hypothetical protein
MKTLGIVLLSGLLWSAGIAQIYIEPTLGTIVDNNIDNNYLQVADRIGSGSVAAGYQWPGETTGTDLSYAGSFSYYSRIIDRSFFTHQIKLEHERSFGEDEATTWSLNGEFFQRTDREEYSFYDHQIYGASTSMKRLFTEDLSGEGSYAFRLVRFGLMPQFNYSEHSFTVRSSAHMPTKTTIICTANLGWKLYASSNVDTATFVHSTGQRHAQADRSTPGVTQLSGMVRVGQQLFENTGISFATQYQWNILKESRYVSSDYGIIADDAILDDHYGFEGAQASITLTQLLSGNTRLRVSADVQNKLYASLAAYDVAGNVLALQRKDVRRTYTFTLNQDLPTLGISLNAAFDYIVNSSNDSRFDYTNNAFSLGISMPLR